MADDRDFIPDDEGPDFIPDEPDFVPDPYRDDPRARLLAGGTGAAMLAGGLLGGRFAGAPGAAAGGVAGGIGGRVLENYGRQMMGMTPNLSMLESRVPNLPPWLQRMADPLEQGLIGGAMEGLPAWLVGIPGRGPGVVGRGAGRLAKRAENKAAAAAVQKSDEVAAAGAPTPAEQAVIEQEGVGRAVGRAQATGRARESMVGEIEAAEATTRAARQKAGAEVGRVVTQANSRGLAVSLDDIAQEMAEQQTAQFGRAANHGYLVNQAARRLRDVMRQHSLGAMRGPRRSRVLDARGRQTTPEFNLGYEDAARVVRFLEKELAPSLSKAERGVNPKPHVDAAIRSVLRRWMSESEPAIKGANKAAREAIKEHQDVSRMAAGVRGPTVRRLQQTQRERVAAEGARASVQRSPALEAVEADQRRRVAETIARQDFNRPFWEPHITAHGFSFPAPTVGRLALGASRAAESPWVQYPGRYGSDVLNILLRALQPQMVPVAPPDSLTPP